MKRNTPRLMSKWYALATQVHDHFGLSAEERGSAVLAARRSPGTALRIYRTIAHTLKPFGPMRG